MRDELKQIHTVNDKQIEILKREFPECFDRDGKFISEKLNQIIKDSGTDITQEYYTINWLGKSYAKLLANDSVRTLLSEDKQHNSQPQNQDSQNILIKGDNLEVLKHLKNSYSNKIKIIYIDPLYNTGSDDFVYKDDRSFTKEQLSELADISIDEAQRILDFTQRQSNSHSAWLTFMYPRLYIAKSLLKDDGVIFISIDDNEQAQLKLLCNEVFGEGNYIGQLSVENNPKGRKNSEFISVSNDYCLIFAKNKEYSSFIENIPKNASDMREDENGRLVHQGGRRVIVGENDFNSTITDLGSDKHYSVYYCKNDESIKIEKERSLDDINHSLISQGYCRYISFRNGEFAENTYTGNKFSVLFENNALDFKDDKIFENNYKEVIRIKSIITNQSYTAIINGKNIDYVIDVKTTSAGTYLKKIFNHDEVLFSNPKTTGLIKLLTTLFQDKDFIILDFFAGSGTTGDAVMQLNADDGGNRRYILVQIPEPIEQNRKPVAYNFIKNELGKENPTIFDITAERLCRAGKKIITEWQTKHIDDLLKDKSLTPPDIGFRIFETKPVFENYLTLDENAIDKELAEVSSYFTEDNLQDLLTTWQVYDGIQLTNKLQITKFDRYTGYYYGNYLYLMHTGFTTASLKALINKIDEDKTFVIIHIIIFGFNFNSKTQLEMKDAITQYKNKKNAEIEIIVRY